MAEFNCEILAILEDIEIDEKHRLQYRIVSWNNGTPVFEIRPLNLSKGEWRHGQHIFKAKKEILETLVKEKIFTRAVKAFKDLKGAEE